jgi:lysophospholipase L1-like esterase
MTTMTMRRIMGLSLLALLLAVGAGAQGLGQGPGLWSSGPANRATYGPVNGTVEALVWADSTEVATTGTAEEVLKTYTVPVGYFSKATDMLRILVSARVVNSNSKILRVRVGGIGGSAIALTSTSNIGIVQNITLTRSPDAGVLRYSAVEGGGTASRWEATNITGQNFAAAIDIVVTGETGTSAGDLVINQFYVWANQPKVALWLGFGDSKTTNSNKYQVPLQTALMASQKRPISYVNVAVGGATLADMAATVVADTAAINTDEVQWVFANIGANDAGNLVLGPADQATWEANLGHVLDTFHSRWPASRAYVMRPWTRNDPADCDLLAGWIANVVSARSTWARLGPDERIFLENGDNGVTYTADGVHPNVAGYALTAQEWQAVMEGAWPISWLIMPRPSNDNWRSAQQIAA